MNAPVDTDADLASFLTSAKDHGIGDEFIVSLLRQNGWPERRVFRAFASHYSGVLGLPIPVRSQQVEQAREGFLYLINFITLGFWTVALGQIWYRLIARWLPDALDSTYFSQNLRSELSWQIATIVTALPIFALIHALIRKELRRRPEMYESGVRKWLTYLALVIAALVVLTDGVWFTNAFLQGELSTRFILDSIVLLLLGGGVFTYYLATMNPPGAQE
jgi:hypothetical protein